MTILPFPFQQTPYKYSNTLPPFSPFSPAHTLFSPRMATRLGTCAAVAPSRSLHLPAPELSHPFLLHRQKTRRNRKCVRLRATVSDTGGPGGDSSYLDMWKKAVERDRKTTHFSRILDGAASSQHDAVFGSGSGNPSSSVEDDLKKKTTEFQKLLEVPSEERDRVQRMQVIDRAAAAISAARAILDENGSNGEAKPAGDDSGDSTGKLLDGKILASALLHFCFPWNWNLCSLNL